jgi:phage gp29-like protein
MFPYIFVQLNLFRFLLSLLIDERDLSKSYSFMAKRKATLRNKSNRPSPASSVTQSTQSNSAASVASQDRTAPPLAASSVTDQIGRITDYYRYGNPARSRTGSIPVRSHWPELTGGIYSQDAALYELYEEILAKDLHIFGQIQTRLSAVKSRPTSFVPSSTEPADQEVCDFVKSTLEAIGGKGGFYNLLSALLYGVATGLSIVELQWAVARGALPAGPGRSITDAVIPSHFKHVFPGHFVFDKDGQVFLSTDTKSPLDRRRLLIFCHAPVYDNPYGVGLLSRLQWVFWFKKQALTFWLRAGERTAIPNTIGSYNGTYNEQYQRDLLQLLEDLQNSGVAVKPDTWSIEVLHKAERSGAFGEGFEKLCAFLNDEISKAVVGSTLTSSEGRRSGSLALGQIHDQVRSEKIEEDARLLMEVINHQLIRPLVDFNFGPAVPAPRFVIDTDEKEDLKAEIEIDKALLESGVSLETDYFYEKYGRPKPTDQKKNAGDLAIERALPLTDSALRNGIVDVNEVRRRFGLPPAPKPVNPQLPATADDVEPPDDPDDDDTTDMSESIPHSAFRIPHFMARWFASGKKKALKRPPASSL